MVKLLSLFLAVLFSSQLSATTTTGSIGHANASEDPHFFNSNANPNNYVNPSDDFNTINDINYDGTRRDWRRDMKTNTKVNEIEELEFDKIIELTRKAGNLQIQPGNRHHESRAYTGNLQHDDRIYQ